MNTKIRLSGIIEESIANGPGIRMVIFAQGCPHRCEGCHNPQTHDPALGYETTIGEILSLAKSNPLLDGVTFSGGDPFMQAEAFAKLAKVLKVEGYHITTYTGYIYEALLKATPNHKDWSELLYQTDLLIDGPFEITEKSGLLKFRGSKNQRLINVPKSLESSKIVLEIL